VKTSLSVTELRDGIGLILDSNDKFVVAPVGDSTWATRGIAKDVTDWMQRNI
jgi:hypothetical protein